MGPPITKWKKKKKIDVAKRQKRSDLRSAHISNRRVALYYNLQVNVGICANSLR